MKAADKKEIKEDILREAKVLGIRPGAAETVAEKVATNVAKWAEKRSGVTEKDLERKIAENLKKYNADLAEMFKIRGKII